MDPALWELLRAGHGTQQTIAAAETEAIIRLRRPEEQVPGVHLVAVFGTVATCRLSASAILETRRHPNVASLKAPRRLAPEREDSRPGSARASDVRRPPNLGLTGRGVVVGVVDWGLDFDHANFKLTDGTTRLLALWDQRSRAPGRRPQPYGYGTVHDRAAINRAVATDAPYAVLGYHPAAADSGGGAHGTHVTDIAAGNGQVGPAGVAPEADLVFVHLADRDTGGLANLGDSVRLLEAVDFIRRIAGSRPWVINLSVGRHGGPHDGSTLTEVALDELHRSTPGAFVVQSTGNYYTASTHATGRLAPGQRRTLTLRVNPADTSVNEVEVWYPGRDRMVVHVQSPGSAAVSVSLGQQARLLDGDEVVGRVYHRARDPNNGDNHIDAFLYPQGQAGMWRITLEAEQVVDGRFHAWVERDEACPGCQARFATVDVDPGCTTGTIANGRLPLVVGAYDGHRADRPLAGFTSSGPTRDGRAKPDLTAPGVDVIAARSATANDQQSRDRLVRKSGSSMATPHVTGAVALCLQAGGNGVRAQQIRDLVLGTVRPVTREHAGPRVGGGYLDLSALVGAALELFPDRMRLHKTKGFAMETELDPVARLALAPSRAYRELMYRPRGDLARWIAQRFSVVASPGQMVLDSPQRGDVLLKVTLGHHDDGSCTVLERSYAPPRRLAPGQVLLRPQPGGDSAHDDTGIDAERTPVVVDTAVAVPPFAAAERANVVLPLLTKRQSDAALAWNNRMHPTTSSVIVDEIRGALTSYVDAAAVQTAIQARNQKNPSQPIDAATATTDAVVAECVHQFQVKCYLDTAAHDGMAGESTLDSLGLVARSGTGMHAADRSHAGARDRLNDRNAAVKSATNNEFSARNWFDNMCDPSVFGLRTKLGRGLHVAMVRRLRVAERHLLSLPAFQNMTPARLGTALGITEKHGGARPTQTDSTSVHTFGLAIDISYVANPWVHQTASWDAMKRAALLISGVRLQGARAPAYFHSLGSDPARSTGQIYDEVQVRSSELSSYFALRNDNAALRAALQAARQRGTAGVFSQGETLGQAVARWHALITDDRRELVIDRPSGQRDGDFKGHAPPERGFLTHHRDLVVALRDHACLAWGAVDLGPGASGSGDIMHFDHRVDGVGRVLTVNTAAFVPTAGHPCLAAPAGAAGTGDSLAESTPEHVVRARRIWKRLFAGSKALAKVGIHDLAQAPSKLISGSDFSAWTNSPTAIYVSENPGTDDLFWEVLLFHEACHVKQFIDAGGTHPKQYETMVRYECAAYTDTARWLESRRAKGSAQLLRVVRSRVDQFCNEIARSKPAETSDQREARYRTFLLTEELLPPHARLAELYAASPPQVRPGKSESVPEPLWESDEESRLDKARSTIKAQTARWGTDEAAVFAVLRALSPSEMAQLITERGLVDVLQFELAGSELAMAAGLLARGRVGSMARADVDSIIAAPGSHAFGTLAAAMARDVLLGHQESFDRTGTGTIQGVRCAAPVPAGATASDCTIYVVDVLRRAFEAKGNGRLWTAALREATRTSGADGLKGTHLIRALQAQQRWEAVFWSPDPRNPADARSEHPHAYKAVRERGTYYGISVDPARSVIEYRRTSPASRVNLANLERLRRLPFGIFAADGGTHMALMVNGDVYEVHWSDPATDRNTIEATPLERYTTYLSGVVAAPTGDLDLAWRTP